MSGRQAGVRQKGMLVSEEAPLGPPSYGVKSERCQKGNPPCLTLRNGLSKETDKARGCVGRGAQAEGRGVREARTALPHGSQSWVLWSWG